MFLAFLTENWLPIIVALVIVAYVLYLTITKQWTKIREFAYQLMLLAERTFGNDEGKIKFDFVVRVVYKNLPIWLKPFLSEEKISKIVQAWYNKAKDFLDDGKFNDSV